MIMNTRHSLLQKSNRSLVFKSLFKSISLLGLIGSNVAMADCNCGSTDVAKPCTSGSIEIDISPLRFSWTFESGGSAAACGQFANGDYWVAPMPGRSGVSITSIKAAGGGDVYLDENPTLESMGFLSKDYGNLNTAENIASSLPKAFNTNTSLVAAVQRKESGNNECGTKAILGSCVEAYNVVTVLSTIPENAGSTTLRPNITRKTKELLNWNDIDLTRLPNKSYFEGSDIAGFQKTRDTWSHHIETLSLLTKEGEYFSEGGRAFRADLVTDDYAASVAKQWHDDLMTIFSSQNSFSDKEEALAAMLSYGKDLYFAIFDESGVQDRVFGTGAGQWLGRYPAAVFFAAMAKDPSYGLALQRLSANLDVGENTVHELSQLHSGPNGPVWGDQKEIYNQYDLGRYWEELFLNKEYEGGTGNGKRVGKKTFRDPYALIDGPGAYPGGSYASVSAGPIKAFSAAMLLMPQMCDIVNNDNPVVYSIRITDKGIQADNDSCAPPDPRESSGCNTYHARDCSYYGLSNTGTATWGPDPADLTKCITNGTDPITGKAQTGRFTSRHGEEFNIGYPVYQVENNWKTIVAGRDSCRVLKRPNPPTGLRVNPS